MLALLNLNLIVFLLLLVLLFRNLVKLSFERSRRRIGSRFKAKLVLAFLFLALTPGILIFIVASNFITTSIEGWFKPQVERPLDQALEVAQAYYQTLESTALRHGRYIARVDRARRAPRRRQPLRARAFLAEQRDRLGLSAITVFNRRGAERAHVKRPGAGRPAHARAAQGEGRPGSRRPGGHHRPRARQRRHDPGGGAHPERRAARSWASIVIGTHVSQRLEARLRGISQAFQEYKQLKLLKTPIKGIYILLFMLMTLIIVFSATWFGLYLARGITEPIQMLAEGTREVPRATSTTRSRCARTTRSASSSTPSTG